MWLSAEQPGPVSEGANSAGACGEGLRDATPAPPLFLLPTQLQPKACGAVSLIAPTASQFDHYRGSGPAAAGADGHCSRLPGKGNQGDAAAAPY